MLPFKRSKAQRNSLARLKNYTKWRGNALQQIVVPDESIRQLANDGLVEAMTAKSSEELDDVLDFFTAEIRRSLVRLTSHFILETIFVDLTIVYLGWTTSLLMLFVIYISIRMRL